jgi:signal transduction histidine kinase
MSADSPRIARLREVEVWIARVRLVAVLFGVLEVGVLSENYPSGYEDWAWIVTAVFGVGAVLLFLGATRFDPRATGVVALLFDTSVIAAYATVYSFEYGSPTRWALMFVVVEAALRYGLLGSLVLPLVLFPYLVFAEWWRVHHFHDGPGFIWDRVTFPFGVFLITGAIVGWLVKRLEHEAALAETRAREAESLRDTLGRRVDVLEAANRCARALGSSLELEEAFQAFVRELRGLIPFDRMSIVLVDGGRSQVMITAGAGAETTFPPGSSRPVEGSLLEEILEGKTVMRDDMDPPRYPEEREFVALGLRSRVAAPLLVGARAIGMLAVVRAAPRAFGSADVELMSLLGRLVGTAVQNIRAYEAEHETVEELRRLSALRADFVSLVSHELRSPMAAVIGSARTLQERWRVLTPEQRESFLALIADETGRLASLIADVLDTSRIEAGTFSYTFEDVDVAELVRDAVAAAQVGQDEIRLQAKVEQSLPRVRGDRERLRQVLANLVDNAIKYSPVGEEVVVRARADDGRVFVDVSDRGPGIPREQQRAIFEKFGRANTSSAKPGTGLGLFIARSIAEAHGGALDVRSAPEEGATFTLALPLGPS